MKFSPQHHEAIVSLIAKNGFSSDHFNFVKKRGRIQLVEQSSERFFSFIAVKQTELNPENFQLEDRTFFKIKSQLEKESTVENWELVLKAMSRWMKALKV